MTCYYRNSKSAHLHNILQRFSFKNVKTVFCQINCAKRFNVTIYASLDVYKAKLGGVVWMWGVIKEDSGGLVKSHDSYFGQLQPHPPFFFKKSWDFYTIRSVYLHSKIKVLKSFLFSEPWRVMYRIIKAYVKINMVLYKMPLPF